MIDKTRLHLILNEYKKDFPKLFWTSKTENEKYKWVAVKHFQDNWDIDAENFSEMLAKSLAKTENLLASQGSFPKGMIIAFSKANPEKVREMFKKLFDEKISVVTRIEDFMKSSEKMRSQYEPKDGKGWKSHYQNPNSISTYLWLRYPDKYYIYKYSEVREVANELDRSFKPTKGAKPETILGAIKLYDELAEYFATDSELVELLNSHLDDSCYPDPKLRTLAIDVGFYISRYYKDKQTQKNSDGWWPSLQEYNPNISKDDWKKYILEVEKPNHPSPMQMLKAMVELGGEASCKKISDVYGGTPYRYVGCTMNIGRRVKNYFNLAACKDGDQERYFSFPFLGKKGSDGDYIYKLRPELFEALKELDLSDVSPYYTGEDDEMLLTDVSKNTILYGPPGTGKTYNTAIYAVSICDNTKTLKDLEEIAKTSEGYAEIQEIYNDFVREGRIVFTTFHQSYGYEDFIEGIKPKTFDNDGKNDIAYDVEPGVFKKFCTNSSVSAKTFDEAWDDLVDKAIQQGNTYEFKRRSGSLLQTKLRDENSFVVNWSTGASNTLKKSRVYEQWASNGYASKSSVSGGTRWYLEAGQAIIDEMITNFNLSSYDSLVEKKPCVFIIDEINRGNVSKIFGELITLIEDDKRETTSVLLPYSGDAFTVPSNVYILGTMNTADRSITALDTALRRRFSFVEMMPNPDVEFMKNVEIDGINISEMLRKINKRIEVLFDREHTIGHAYFKKLTSNDSIEKLAEIFENKIIPLLQEYFYEDYEKIRLVLGDNQVTEEDKQFILKKAVDITALFGNSEIDIIDDSVRYSINKNAFNNSEAYIKIYK